MSKFNEQIPGGPAAFDMPDTDPDIVMGGDIALFGQTGAIAQFKLPDGVTGMAHVESADQLGPSKVRFATEDDFEDDCPICEMMRARVRAGEKIEIHEFEL